MLTITSLFCKYALKVLEGMLEEIACICRLECQRPGFLFFFAMFIYFISLFCVCLFACLTGGGGKRQTGQTALFPESGHCPLSSLPPAHGRPLQPVAFLESNFWKGKAIQAAPIKPFQQQQLPGVMDSCF